MNKFGASVLIAFLAVLLFSHCAKKGSPSGGPKDTIPPIILKSNPENYTTNFDGKEIRVYFDEFIKLNDLQQSLVVSPPLKYQPIVTPVVSAKVLKVKIQDTLKENTTYVFNFGRSIVDNNEANEYDYFKYVFSTGDYIDSLKVRGSIKESLLPELEAKTTVMLYAVNDDYTDSIVFKEKPFYVSSTREGSDAFELTNIKEGKYLLVAIQEENNDYQFNPSTDKFAFHPEMITVPLDTSFTLTLFKEVPQFSLGRASHVKKNRIVFGYEGLLDSLQIEPLFKLPEGYETRIIKDPAKDSLNYWFKPSFDIELQDTLQFVTKYAKELDTVTVRLRDLYPDSLEIKKLDKGVIIPRDSLKFSASTPIESFQADSIQILDKDSLIVAKELFLDRENNEISIAFNIKEEQIYRLTALPGAFKDFYNNVSDTLQFTYRTLPISDYGTLQFRLEGLIEFPLVVELVDDKYKVIASQFLSENESVFFDYLEPNNYFLRLIFDSNGNKQWDAGNFLKKIQPEKVVYYPTPIEIRAYWSVNETFIFE